jgi:hypothetical protein
MDNLVDFQRKEISILNCKSFAYAIEEAVLSRQSGCTLDLSGNDICDDCLETFQGLIFSNQELLSRILKLDLSLNRITARGLAYLAPCLRSKFVPEIDLRYNYLNRGDLAPYNPSSKCITLN